MTLKHYDWVDGMKGVACTVVCLNHFNNVVPLGLPLILVNGQLMVWLFVQLSCFLSALSLFAREGSCSDCCAAEGKWVFKRYVSLFIPVLGICFIVIIANGLGMFGAFDCVCDLTGGGSPSTHYGEEINLGNAVKVALLAPLKQEDDFCFPIWMLHHIFLGNIICMLVVNLTRPMKMSGASIVCICLTPILYKGIDPIYALAPLSVLAARISAETKFEDRVENQGAYEIPSLIMLLISVSIGCGIIDNLDIGLISTSSFALLIGSISLFGAFWSGRLLRKMISILLLRSYIGRKSMGIYYVHQPILSSITCWAYLFLSDIGFEGIILKLCILIFYFGATLLFAGLFSKMTENLNKIAVNRVYPLLLQR